jgi:hypothetical protein
MKIYRKKKKQLHDAMLEDDPAWIYLEMQEIAV